MGVTARAAAATAAAAAVLALAACSSGGSSTAAATATVTVTATAAAQPAASGTPANPVPILKKTGAKVPAGTVNGQVDIEGDRYADGGAAPDKCGGPCEQVSVYTFKDAAAQQADIARNSPEQDGHAMIKGSLFDVSVVGYQDTATGAWVFGSLSPQVIAQRVGGTVVK